MVDPIGLTRGLSIRQFFDEQKSSLRRLAHVQRVDDALQNLEEDGQIAKHRKFDILRPMKCNVDLFMIKNQYKLQRQSQDLLVPEEKLLQQLKVSAKIMSQTSSANGIIVSVDPTTLKHLEDVGPTNMKIRISLFWKTCICDQYIPGSTQWSFGNLGSSKL